jgi:cob(I)alamin adenosyltransferase
MPEKTKKPLPISTKTGDAGQSGLANGQRLSKDSLVFEVLGTLDELNSWLGLVVSDFLELSETYSSLSKHRQFLLKTQDTLFFLGAEVAQSASTAFPNQALSELERKADTLQNQMAKGWTTQFLLPGGAPAAARLDVARTVCRRGERRLVSLAQEQQARPMLAKYLNRLSDYLFILRCFTNQTLEFEEKKFESKYLQQFQEKKSS